jgi:quercetin dioxygenase-like cupin family protein
MHHALRLPFHFDPAKLHADLDIALRESWIRHFNQGYFEGDWSGVALRAPRDESTLFANPRQPAEAFVDAPVLARCQAFQAVLANFQCPLRSVRLLRLKPGSVIREHSDPDLGYSIGEVRIHVPVRTNPQLEFYVNQERIIMEEGECWYLALDNLHRVHNLGASDRIHLVIDCVVNDWLRALLEAADSDPIARPARAAGTAQAFEAFRRAVLSDLALQERLRTITDAQAFVSAAVGLGSTQGFHFTPEDVHSALRSSRRAWLERNIL